MTTTPDAPLLAEVQKQLERLQRDPRVVLLQTRDYLAASCGAMRTVLSSGPPHDSAEWLQEFEFVNRLRITAEQYLEAFLAVNGKTP